MSITTTQLASISVDIGGTSIRAAGYNLEGRENKRVARDTIRSRSPREIVNDVAACIRECFNDDELTVPIGIACTGIVDSNSGTVVKSELLNWNNLPLIQMLKAELNVNNLSIYLLNDVVAACLGEWLAGAGQEHQNLACVFVGTGLGSAFILDGHLVPGELGYTILDENGVDYPGSKKGCVRNYFSGLAIESAAKEMASSNLQFGSELGNLAPDGQVTAKIVNALRLQGSTVAVRIFNAGIQHFALALANTVELLGLPLVILGGGVFDGCKDLIPEVERKVKTYLLEATASNLRIVPSILSDKAGLIGAALYARKK